ncbi:MAG TPA: GNAT family N-acetyltransferase [Burkholderiaceae bacterium]|jgi:GNAT superfamily N-acetyltransferase|nr:GNAT family N-acetyltransferase [Burkholderiaceae bacterium]
MKSDGGTPKTETQVSIEVINEKPAEAIDILMQGLCAYNHSVAGDGQSEPLSAFARIGGEVIGGVSGRTVYRHFLIEAVWIHESLPGTELGRRLMQSAEEEALHRGCVAAQVDTLSFQGVDFYRRLDFDVIGKVPDFPPGHDRYFMLKRYGAARSAR